MTILVSANNKTIYNQETSDNILTEFRDMLDTAESSGLYPFCMNDIIHRAEKKLAACN
ncbi:MAG: hypothetical protein AAFP10_04565 [Pseudomonadota bacterium]